MLLTYLPFHCETMRLRPNQLNSGRRLDVGLMIQSNNRSSWADPQAKEWPTTLQMGPPMAHDKINFPLLLGFSWPL